MRTIIQIERLITKPELYVVDIRPAGMTLTGEVIERRLEHGEQSGAPDTEIVVMRMTDGTIVERSCSMSIGNNILSFSGYSVRKV